MNFRALNAESCAQCRVVRSTKGRRLDGGRYAQSGVLRSNARLSAQCRSVRPMRDRVLVCRAVRSNAGPCARMQVRAIESRAVRSTQGREPECKAIRSQPYAPCRAVLSMQGRALNAGACAQCKSVSPEIQAQCKAVQPLQGRTRNAGPSRAQCKSLPRSMSGRRLLNAGAPCGQCRAVRSMQRRTLNARPFVE